MVKKSTVSYKNRTGLTCYKCGKPIYYDVRTKKLLPHICTKEDLSRQKKLR